MARIKSMFSGESDVSDESYEYQCLSCDDRFEAAEAAVSEVTCPQCGSINVQSAA